MGVPTQIRWYAALGDVGLEVVKPRLGPVRFGVDVSSEPNCGSVMCRCQHLSSDGALGPSEGPQNPFRVREDENSTCIKKHCGGRVATSGHTQNVHRHRQSPTPLS